MILKNIKWVAFAACASLLFVQCSDDDEGTEEPSAPTFEGNFAQEDIMGRPGITTVFGGTDAIKNNFNASIPSERTGFVQGFQDQLEAYHDVYGTALNVDLDYETNSLGLDAATFAAVLATTDALQVAPDAPTTYSTLTGRTLQDDVIDISLTLMFGGADGDRFDGTDGTPQLTSDGVDAGDRVFSGSFPYMEAPNN